MSLKQTSSALSPTRCPYPPPCLPPPCLLLSSPSLWSPPTLQVHPLCPSPRSPLQLLHRLHLLCHALHNPNLTIRALCWPPTTNNWYRTTIITHSSSPKLATLNYRIRQTNSWFSAIPVPSSHPHNNLPSSPSRALFSSRPLYRTVLSAGGVLLMMAATWTTRRGLEGELNLFTF